MPSSSDPSLSRRERERQRRRQAMLNAARAVFAEKGYTDATLDEIAERAEFGKGTLYNYFEGGKEALLFAVFEEVIGEMEDLIHTVFQEGLEDDRPLRDAFHTFVEQHFQLIRDQQDLFLILVREAHLMAFSDNTERVQFFQRQQERLLDALIPPLEEAMEHEEIQTLPASSVANLLLANVRGMGTHCTLERRHCPSDDHDFLHKPELAADFLTTLLFDGLETNGSPV